MALNYRATATITITLASLATSSTGDAGRESTVYDNATNKDPGGWLAGKITTGTSPTAGQISVFVAGQVNDTPLYVDVLDGTDSAETFTSVGIRDASVRRVAVLDTDATSNRTYWFGPVDLGLAFGGILPARFSLFVTHNTVVVLHATGSNHAIYFTPYYFS